MDGTHEGEVGVAVGNRKRLIRIHGHRPFLRSELETNMATNESAVTMIWEMV